MKEGNELALFFLKFIRENNGVQIYNKASLLKHDKKYNIDWLHCKLEIYF